MAEVASAFVSLIPSARGFGRATEKQIAPDIDRAGKKSGSRFGGMMAVGLKTGALAGGVAVAALTKQAVSLEAEFSKTMNVLRATTGASSKEMQNLSDLAMKMGADTVFSASDAGQAMLELARGGIKPAEIAAGGIQGTLTLAAAGELEMAEAANIAVKSMGQFNLAGKDMDGVAAALAGAANASSASVRDMSQALAQGGLAANSVGFSVQETTAVLAAFSNAGLEGSDAGTSMKTMLDRLQPATEKSSAALEKMGIITKDGTNQFIKANGEFKDAADIAGLLKKGTEALDAAERKRLITQAFGSDAQRAATIFANEGAEGLNRLLKATSDTGAAQKMAAANMKGTSGAIEQLKGSVETLMLRFGQLIAPAVQAGLRWLTDLVNRAAAALSGAGTGAGWIQQVSAWVRNDLVPAFRNLAADVLPLVPKYMAAAKDAFSDAKPFFSLVGNIITNVLIPGIGKLAQVAIPVLANQLRMTGKVLGAIGKAGRSLWNDALQPTFKFIAEAVARTLKMWGEMFQLIGKAPGFGWAKELGNDLVGAANKAHELSMNIRDIPDSKTVNLNVNEHWVTTRTVRKGGMGPVPALAAGGVIARPTLALVGEGRESEAVVPLSKLSMMLDRERAAGAAAGGAGRQVLHVYDRDNVLLGTMEAVADGRINGHAQLAGQTARAM
jgi:TP901 family phage tail tape measure protein